MGRSVGADEAVCDHRTSFLVTDGLHLQFYRRADSQVLFGYVEVSEYARATSQGYIANRVWRLEIRRRHAHRGVGKYGAGPRKLDRFNHVAQTFRTYFGDG